VWKVATFHELSDIEVVYFPSAAVVEDAVVLVFQELRVLLIHDNPVLDLLTDVHGHRVVLWFHRL